MDPISIVSIIAACASIATATSKAALQIDELRTRYRDAPEDLQILVTNLRTIEAIIGSLYEKYSRKGVKLPKRHLELLDAHLHSFAFSISRLQTYIDTVKNSIGPTSSITTRQKIRHLFNDSIIQQYQSQLIQQTQILDVYSRQLDGLVRDEDLDDALDDATTVAPDPPPLALNDATKVDLAPPHISLDDELFDFSLGDGPSLELPFNDSVAGLPDPVKRRKKWYHGIFRSDKVSKELIEAAQCGNPEWISKLVEDGANIDYRDRLGKTALHHAAEAGKNDALSCLLTLGADTEAACKGLKLTPLHMSAGSTAEALLQAGASPFACSRYQAQPLHIAVSQNSLTKVQKLISYGAPVNKRDKFGFTPLLIAAVSGSERLVKELLQAGADPNLHRYNIIKSWKPEKANPKITPFLDFGTALCIATTEGVIKTLLSHGVASASWIPSRSHGVWMEDDFFDRWTNWMDPLMNALELHCSPSVIRELLERGADVTCDHYEEILVPGPPTGWGWQWQDNTYCPEIKRLLDKYAPHDVMVGYKMWTPEERKRTGARQKDEPKRPNLNVNRGQKRQHGGAKAREQKRAASVSFRDGYSSAGFAADLDSDEESNFQPSPKLPPVPRTKKRNQDTQSKRHNSFGDSPLNNLRPPAPRRGDRYSDPMPTLSEDLDRLDLNNSAPNSKSPSKTRRDRVFCDVCSCDVTSLYCYCRTCVSFLCSVCILLGDDCPDNHKDHIIKTKKQESSLLASFETGNERRLKSKPSRSFQERVDSRPLNAWDLPKNSRFGSELKPSDSISQVGFSERLSHRKSSRDLKTKKSRLWISGEYAYS